MDAPPWKDAGGRGEAYPDETVRTSQTQMIRTCVGAGLSAADAEDLAQDVWTWIVGAGVPVTVVATPWLKAVVHNYILRFRRRSGLHREREGRRLETAPEQASSRPEAVVESNELLNNLAPLLPARERCLLALIRRGYTLPEAARRLRIPPGSRAYYQGRLIAYARRALKRPAAIPIKRAGWIESDPGVQICAAVNAANTRETRASLHPPPLPSPAEKLGRGLPRSVRPALVPGSRPGAGPS